MFQRFCAIFLAFLAWCSLAVAGEQTLLDGKATVTLPSEMTAMSDELKNAKYPAGKVPKEVFGNERGTISFAAKTGAYPPKMALDALVTAMAGGLDKAGAVASWTNKGVKKIGDQEFGFLEFISKAPDSDIYNHIYFTRRGDELVVFTVNSTVGLLDEWRDRLNGIVESTRVTKP